MTTTQPQTPLYQAYALLKEGRQKEAQEAVVAILKRNPDNADAWYLASRLTDSYEKRVQALERALAIDPRHAKAQASLARLRPGNPLDEFLPNHASAKGEAIRAQQVAASTKSYTNAAVIVLVLYFILWLPGLIANFMYLEEANRMEKLAGRALPGVGALRLERIMFALLPLVGLLALAILFLLGTAVMSTTRLR
jgi:tetratricopeptide (TPR) repeat protein